MSDLEIPESVTINGKSYNVSEGWAGTLNLSNFGPVEFTAREPFAHISGLFFVYDKNGNKVGEFQCEKKTILTNNTTSGGGNAPSGCSEAIGAAIGAGLVWIICFIFKLLFNLVKLLFGLACLLVVSIFKWLAKTFSKKP